MPDPISAACLPNANACYPEDTVSTCTSTDASATPSAPAPSQPPAVSALVARFSPANGSGGGVLTASGNEVLFCHRVADVPHNSRLKLEHHFLATSTRAAGAGHCGDGVPGHGKSDRPFSEMCIVDHTAEVGAPGVTCQTVVADEACVDRALQLGADLGPWAPPFNDCQTFVAQVLAECAVGSSGSAEGASGLGEQVGSYGE